MKNIFFIILSALFIINSEVYSQKEEDVVGFWLTLDDKTNEPKSQIQIVKGDDGKYSGKIVWLKELFKNNQPLKDENNPNEENRNVPILGLQMLYGFQFTGEIWENGAIYDPKSGNTYRCKMWFEDNNKNLLYLRGFIGISLFGRSTQWVREEQKRINIRK
jgi:uncharacterized protein (DUF2147 family)